MRRFILPLLLVAFALVSACSGKKAPIQESPGLRAKNSMPMPRADPGYLQYLERQTMLTKSSEMARVVSGSQLAWRTSASIDSPDELLTYADAWLAVHPLTLLTSSRQTTFDQLADSSIWATLREVGVKGLYVAPVAGSGALWARGGSVAPKGLATGEDIVQYDFSAAAGGESNYRRLMSSVIDHTAVLGSDLVPAATGIGPDFYLAARNMREYPGIYCMVEVPSELWKDLPAAASEWETAALNAEQASALNAKGILPVAMRDEVSALASRGGWAATGEVRGIDGNPRRWVYRYYENPSFAVLNWEDPSQSAHRILSGSAVRQVGVLGQALIGLRFEAFQGLEAAPKTRDAARAFSAEPALSAAQSMSREIRRYGGWSWLRDDDLPLAIAKEFLRYGADYVYDNAFTPAAEHALLTGDATLARFMADELLRLGIDARRLVHTTPAQEGINYNLPHLTYLAGHDGSKEAVAFRDSIHDSLRAGLHDMSPSPLKDNVLYSTGAGLAAMALGLSPYDVPKDQTEEVAKGHALLIFFKAMQPGALMLSGQDLAGVLPLSWKSSVNSPDLWNVADACRGAYALTSAAASLVVSPQGVARAKSIYPVPDTQVHQEGSFLRNIGRFLRMRSQTGIAKGGLAARPATRGQGSIALLTRLPDEKSYVLSVCNFGRDTVTEHISLGKVPGIRQAMDRVTPLTQGGGFSAGGSEISVTLGPWQGKALLLGGGPDSAGKKEPADAPERMPPPEIPPVPAAKAESPATKAESPSAPQAPPAAPTPQADPSAAPDAPAPLAPDMAVPAPYTTAPSPKEASPVPAPPAAVPAAPARGSVPDRTSALPERETSPPAQDAPGPSPADFSTAANRPPQESVDSQSTDPRLEPERTSPEERRESARKKNEGKQ